MPISNGVQYTDLGTSQFEAGSDATRRNTYWKLRDPKPGIGRAVNANELGGAPASDIAEQPQRPSGSQGGRQQRPVTMSDRDTGAVTSDGTVIPNSGYMPDPKRQDAFDSRARTAMRQNAEAARQQYFDGVRANDSIRDDQFKRGVDEVNQRGFNLYGVMKDIDASGEVSQDQARMLDSAATDFGKQVAANYGWKLAGAEYDWDSGAFTFQFQNAQGQVGTKTMSRKALEAQMVKAGYVDDPVEVRRREMAEEAERQKTDLATAKLAADLGFKEQELAQNLQKAGMEHTVKLIEAASKLRGEDGQLDDFGKAILSYAIRGLIGDGGQGGQHGGQPRKSAAAATLMTGTSGSTDSRRSQRQIGAENAELNERIEEQGRRAARTRELSRTPSPGVGEKPGAAPRQTSDSVSVSGEATSSPKRGKTTFGSGVAANQEASDELSELRRRAANGILASDDKKRLAELESKSKDDPNNAARDAEISDLERREKSGTITGAGKERLHSLRNQQKIDEGIYQRQAGSTKRAEEIGKEASDLAARTKSETDRMNQKYAESREREKKRREEQAKYEANEAARKEALAKEKADKSVAAINEAEARRAGRKTEVEAAKHDSFRNADRMDRVLIKQAQNIELTDEEKNDAKEYHRVMKIRALAESARKKNDEDKQLTKEEHDALQEWESLHGKHDPLASYVETKFSKKRKA